MPKHRALRGVHLAGTRPTSLPPCPCVGTLKLVDSQMKTLPKKGSKQRANFTPNDAGRKRTFAGNAGHAPVDDRDILYSLNLTLSFTLSGYSILFLSILTDSISQCKCRNLPVCSCIHLLEQQPPSPPQLLQQLLAAIRSTCLSDSFVTLRFVYWRSDTR